MMSTMHVFSSGSMHQFHYATLARNATAASDALRDVSNEDTTVALRVSGAQQNQCMKL